MSRHRLITLSRETGQVMKENISNLIPFFAILLLITPLVNLVMLPGGEYRFLISAALLFMIWLVLILMTYWFRRMRAISPHITMADKTEHTQKK